MNESAVIPFILLFLTLMGNFILPVCADEMDVYFNENGTLDQAHGVGTQNSGTRDMNTLIQFLDAIGFDISYGDNGGTIFSMVDESLTRIISSLSSGNVEGFMDIPLIKETLAYFDLSTEDIVMDPNMTPGRMEAIDSYNQRYEPDPKTL